MGMFTFDCIRCKKTMKMGDHIHLFFFIDLKAVKIVDGLNDYYGLSSQWEEGQWDKIVTEMFNEDANSGLACYCDNCYWEWVNGEYIKYENCKGHQRGIF